MENDSRVKIEKTSEGYMIDVTSNFSEDGIPRRFESLFPEKFYDAIEIIREYGVMPNMVNLNPGEENRIKSGIEKLSRSFDVV